MQQTVNVQSQIKTMPPQVVKQEEPRRPTKPGAFITGDFDSYTMSNNKNE